MSEIGEEQPQIPEDKPERQSWKDARYSRRAMLKLGAAGVGAGAVGLLGRFLTGRQGDAPKSTSRPDVSPVATKPPEVTKVATKEVLNSQHIECGFNTHVYPGRESNLDLKAFKADIDLLAKNGQKVVRFNIASYLAMNQEVEKTTDLPTWNDANMAEYEEAITYAKEKGLKVNLVVESVPRPHVKKEGKKAAEPVPFNHDEFDVATKKYFTELGRRFGKKVDTWQLFNEPDVHNFVDYADISTVGGMTDDYIRDFARFVKTASEALKTVAPDAKTTVNVSRWAHRPGESEDIFFKTRTRLFNKIAPDIDIISLDLYPDTDQAEINTLPKYVVYFAETYHKPVRIAELGLSVVGSNTDQDQMRTITQSIDSLAGGTTWPDEIIIYEERNQVTGDRVEDSYGLLSTTGVPKPTFTQVIEATKRAQEKNPPEKK